MRKFSTMCSRCRERTRSLASIAYSAQVDYDGRKYTISVPDLVVPKCLRCGEFAIDHEASEQFDVAFRQQIGLLLPDEISAQREALGMTQQQLADQLHIDVATLERWEAGFQIQPRSLDLLIRGFFKSPAFFRSLEANHDASSGADKGSAQRALTHPERLTSEPPHEIAHG